MAKLDLNKILEEIKKASSEAGVREVKVDSKDVFSEDEKKMLETTLIRNVADAKIVAEWLAKIKVAEEKKRKDDALLDELEKERDKNNYRGSLTYRVLNANGMVDGAINLLTFLSTGVPEKKDDRKRKIKELEEEIGKKRKEISLNDEALIPLKGNLAAINREKQEVEKKLERREILFSLVAIDPNSNDFSINYQGRDQVISSIPINNVKDFSGSALWDGTAAPVANSSVRATLQRAEGFLNAITKNTTGKNSGKSFVYAKGKGNYFNGRVYQSKQSLTTVSKNIGYGFLVALREFGEDKLKKVVDDSGATGNLNTELKEYVDEIMNCIHYNEAYTGTKGANETNTTGFLEKFDTWQKKILTRSNKEFPYVPAVNWEHIFEFVVNVFPIDGSGKVMTKPYLDDASNANYLASKDANKGWENKVWLKGFSSKPIDGKNISYFIKQPGTDPEIKNELANPNKIPSDWKFKEVIQLWYDSFDPFVDFSTKKWVTGRPNVITSCEEDLENLRCELRYCLTMRGLFSELGVSKNIDAFDSYLLEIADAAEKKNYATDRQQLIKASNINAISLPKEGYASYDLKRIAEGKIWGEDYNRSRALRLKDLTEDTKAELAALNSESRAIEGQIGLSAEKKSALVFAINRIKREMQELKEFDDFDEDSLGDKKKKFNEWYDKKDSQGGKWIFDEIKRRLEDWLPKIKKEMDDANYESEKFKEKEEELQKIFDKCKPIWADIIIQWDNPYQNKTTDGLTSSAIKALLKDRGDDEGKKKLQEISGYFDKLAEEVLLDEEQIDRKKKIDEAIQDPSKYRDKAPKTKITEDDLKEAFKNVDGVVDKALADKWGNANIKKEEIKKVIEKVLDDTKAKFKSEFINHLKSEGLDNGTKLSGTDEEIWKAFLKQDPERVVKTANAHWLETDDNFNATKKDMETVSKGTGDDEEKLDMTNYGSDKKDGDPDKKGAVKYLWEKITGASHKYYKVKEEDKKDDENGNGKKDAPWYSIDSTAGKFLWFGGAPLVVIGVLTAIFWKQISAWWSGPAEEEGQGVERSDEEETKE